MDHRCGERRPVSATVLLRRRGWAGWVVAEFVDLSVSGALLRLKAAALPRHAWVRLEARAPGEGSAKLLHCDAMVVRVAGDRVGIAFDELAPAGLAPLFAGARHKAASRAARKPPAAPIATENRG